LRLCNSHTPVDHPVYYLVINHPSFRFPSLFSTTEGHAQTTIQHAHFAAPILPVATQFVSSQVTHAQLHPLAFSITTSLFNSPPSHSLPAPCVLPVTHATCCSPVAAKIARVTATSGLLPSLPQQQAQSGHSSNCCTGVYKAHSPEILSPFADVLQTLTNSSSLPVQRPVPCPCHDPT
jgi:hypothetical protein